MENQRLIFILVNAITIFCAGLAFTQPLRKRSQWLLWMPLCFALCLGSSFFYFTCTGSWMIAGNIIQYLSLVFLVERFKRRWSDLPECPWRGIATALCGLPLQARQFMKFFCACPSRFRG